MTVSPTRFAKGAVLTPCSDMRERRVSGSCLAAGYDLDQAIPAAQPKYALKIGACRPQCVAQAGILLDAVVP